MADSPRSSFEDEVTPVVAPVILTPSPRRPCLVVLNGPRIGEVLHVGDTPGGFHIGRRPTMQLRLTDDCVSREHARIDVEDDVATLVDLDSTNGTWIAGLPVTQRRLVDGDKIWLGQGTILRFAMLDAAEEACHRQLLEAALRDGLTKAFNRRYFFERLASEAAYAERQSRPTSLLMVDIDHFRKINERYGHVTADGVLARTAEVVRTTVRCEDMVARFGGDELVVLARETPLDGGVRCAERIRGAVAATQYHHMQEPLAVRVSVGVAAMPDRGVEDALGLLERAEQALLRAKRDGRNRVAT